MSDKKKPITYHYYKAQAAKLIKSLGKEHLIKVLKQMLLIRNFEVRAESAYQHGKIGGFFHAYMGQEAIQVAAVNAIGLENWWITTYRCHALALLMGEDPKELMAELYGKATGNALGRGGSMHLYSKRMLGGFGIVGGHVPVATGAAFSSKYLKTDEVAICFLGDGAVVQGAVHESLNLAALWNLPCIYVIENNQWGMGTAVNRAVAAQPIAEKMALSYDMKSYTFDGMDYLSCYEGFSHVYKEVKKSHRPVLIEAVTERFRGHSISDPGLYRSKEQLQKTIKNDPIISLTKLLEKNNMIDGKTYDEFNKEQKAIVMEAMKFADESPWPDPITLEEDVFAGDGDK